MEIIKIHYKISKPVSNYKEIKTDAEPMRRFVVMGNFKGFYNKAFAIAHCQVSETPMSFFVVAPECIKEGMFVDDVIINPEILEAPKFKIINEMDGKRSEIPNTITYQEPCMSFPFRKPKSVIRYDVIKVRYQIAGWFKLKIIEAQLTGIASEIFQHCYDLTLGKNIYFTSETPVKWWELIGTEKSKGGTSLDNADSLGLKTSKTIKSDTEKLGEYGKI